MSLRSPLAVLAALLALASTASAQLAISEIDTRTPGSDSAEFIEIYNGGPGAVDLSDYVVVLFNGEPTGNPSYAAYDLSGSLAEDAYYVLCSSTAQVDNCDLDIGGAGFLQQGTDGVALYRASASDFPNGTSPSSPNRIDAVVYGATSDSNLRSALGVSSQYDEDENGNVETESLQRNPNPVSSGFEALAPTPGESPAGRFPTPTDLDDARALGAGATVTVQGTVTRAEGDFLFFQDATGGLQLVVALSAGVSGDLQADIADGTVRPGTVLNLTGVLSQDRGALQITNDDLQRYGIVGTAAVPDPQVVTLAQLSNNGEQYESELIQIRNVTIARGGETVFGAGNIYDLDDPTTELNSVVARVPSADETRVEGTTIPTTATTLTGPASQRADFGPQGYRILLIDPADVGGNATEGGGGGGGGDQSDLALVISEIDASQTGTDTGEFVELYNAGTTAINLADVVLVLFNGNDDASYDAIDLGGMLAPDAYYVVCSDIAVIDTCNLEGLSGTNALQGGPDAAAIYEAAASDFPDGTAATTTDLIDAVVYGTDDPTDAGLLAALGQTTQYDEDANGAADTESLQRSPNSGTDAFVALAPTPGAAADGGPGGPGTLVTIAEARTAGPGTTVTVRGTVTRSEGDFTYIQDTTGALAIRQTDGAFADFVAINTIQPGIVLEVTGELSEFNGLLQINDEDLTDFEIVGAADVPAPQLVTLAQLASNAEAFESELIALTRVSIDATPGAMFMAGTTYQISDRTSSTNAVTLRVPNADDTEVDGEMVPEGPTTVVGILGQFDTTDPRTSGYQILVIEDTDINPEAVDAEAGPDGALTLALANPVRGTALITFGAETAGAVRLAVFDALGREVAVLASGDAPAGVRSARLDARALAPGVYVVRLETAAGSATRTVTVVR